MNHLADVFRAGRCLRWHTDPRLSGTLDRLDGHQGRVARLLLALHPDPSAALLRAALTHDDGETATGDVPRRVKDAMPHVALEWLEAAEAAQRARIWRPGGGLTEKEERWLDFADALDALMWAAHHDPASMSAPRWQVEITRLGIVGYALGIDLEIPALVQELGR
jgi:hypothetical protein